MATHSTILAWRIPWTEEPGRLQSMGSQGVRRDQSTNTHTPYAVTLNHYAQDNRHHGLSSVPASCLYLRSVGGDGSTLTLPGVQYGGGTAPFPLVFPLVKLFSKLFIHCSTKYLLSSFSVPSSKTKKRKPILVPRALPVQNRQLSKWPCLFPRCLGQEACSPKIAL